MANTSKLRDDALRIWRAGLEAVRSERLMQAAVRVEGSTLVVGNPAYEAAEEFERIDLRGVRQLAVVGAGKAGAGMAAALEEILGPSLAAEKQLVGWVNVPADCVPRHPHPGPLPKGEGEARRIHLHPARPAGVNEPTAEGVAGAEEILRMVSTLGPDDVCIALISGGGSALLPTPIEGITLADKVAVTRFLSAAGADIAELNTVRKQLSRIKGGGLARACRAGRLIALVISDIPGDPLDLIASGPTVADTSTPPDALAILEKFGARKAGVPSAVFDVLNRKADGNIQGREYQTCKTTNIVIGNNALAVDAAGQEAERLGYIQALTCARKPEGAVEPIGRHLADMAAHMQTNSGPNCLISGGEGTVKLAPEAERGLGGRNQQTVLAALVRLQELNLSNAAVSPNPTDGVVILSGGTDGEDGPTDAAGAVIDSQIVSEAKRRGLDAADFLRRNDAYRFFEPLGGLIKTGPTQTNVCDVRVVLVEKNG